MNPLCINDLCFDEIFKAYSNSVQSYVKTSNKNEHIVDSESNRISGFVSATFGQAEEISEKYFEVENPSGRDYALLQIDNGLIKTTVATKKCDCAIVNDEKLCLIEFKANAYSDKLAVIHKNYTKAMEQLSVTLNILKTGECSIGKDLYVLRNIEAFICFRKGYPRKTSTQMNYQILFTTNNDGVPLSFNGKTSL